jgi:steroid delta-isomerase-like uncharacterized protein
MSVEKNKAVVRSVVETYNAGTLEEARAHYASGFVNHDPSDPEARDLDGLMKGWAAVQQGFPDGRIQIEDMIAQGDKVAKRWSFRGTHTADYMGIPATGKVLTTSAITIYRIEDGKVAECWWERDSLGWLQQLGVIPPMG